MGWTLFLAFKGPIKAWPLSLWTGLIIGFNSIKVRLKQDAVDFVLNANYFQFHKGPIKTYCFIRANAAVLRFQFHEGPIKTAFPQVDGNWLLTFQFHEGPIKTSLPAAETGYFDSFNSMKVRLKLIFSRNIQGQKLSFNSMKVRLKQGPKMLPPIRVQFQFHEGPIKTPSRFPRLLCVIWFQSHEGPIKTSPRFC